MRARIASITRLAALAASIAIVASTSAVRADETPAPVASTPTTPADRVHRGGYLRVGVSLGAMSTATTSGDANNFDDASGGTFGLDARLGGSVASGIVLGAAISFRKLGLFGRASSASPGTATYATDSTTDVALFGPLVEWYPDPTRGLHFGGSIAWMELSRATVAQSLGGWALEGHAGFDLWNGGAEAVGIELRFFGGAPSASNGVDESSDPTYRVLAVEALLTALSF